MRDKHSTDCAGSFGIPIRIEDLVSNILKANQKPVFDEHVAKKNRMRILQIQEMLWELDEGNRLAKEIICRSFT